VLQVPVFGMENNPDSLKGRRRGYAIAYGYASWEWEDVTEVIGHVPHVDAHEEWELQEMVRWSGGSRLELEFGSGIVPYSRLWVRSNSWQEALALAVEFEKGSIWLLEKVRAL